MVEISFWKHGSEGKGSELVVTPKPGAFLEVCMLHALTKAICVNRVPTIELHDGSFVAKLVHADHAIMSAFRRKDHTVVIVLLFLSQVDE